MTPFPTTNDQVQAFHFGAIVPNEPFTVEAEVVSPFPVSEGDPINFQSVGIYIGDGSQDDYVKFVVSANARCRWRAVRLRE